MALITALARMSGGDLKTRAPLSGSRDVLDTIAHAVNILADELGYRQTVEIERSLELEKTLGELRETQDQLVQSAKLAALGEFSMGLAHEINNPLMIIRGVVDDIERSIGSNRVPEVSSFLTSLNKINRSIDRVAKIVQHVQDFARPGKQAHTHVCLNDVVGSALELARAQVRMRAIPIEVRFAEPGPVVEASSVALEQVVLNLVSNACDAIEARGLKSNGLIRIFTEPRISEAVLRIQDNGIGISGENIEKIYAPFFTTKPAGRGTGLGLSISHRIIAAHHGRIVCDSQPDRGATFDVILPRVVG